MLAKLPPAAVPLKPSTLPIEVNTMTRDVVLPTKVSVSFPPSPSAVPESVAPLAKANTSSPAPPVRFSKAEKVNAATLPAFAPVMLKVLATLKPINVSVLLLPIAPAMLTNVPLNPVAAAVCRLTVTADP